MSHSRESLDCLDSARTIGEALQLFILRLFPNYIGLDGAFPRLVPRTNSLTDSVLTEGNKIEPKTMRGLHVDVPWSGNESASAANSTLASIDKGCGIRLRTVEEVGRKRAANGM